MSETKYKATVYLRLSHSDDKSNESDSIQNQRKMIDDFLKSHTEIELVSEKVDDGFSGILFDRPAFTEMMEDIEAGKINCVIVKDLSRLGREYIETGRYLRRIFPAYGVRFIAINDSIDTLKDSGDDLVVGVKSIINDAYCRDISVKTRSALDAKRDNGEYVGAFPIYGYRKAEDNHNQLVIDEYPASIVRDIFRMKLDGYSASKIADSLNVTGVLSPLEYKKSRGLPYPKNGYADKADAKWSAHTIIRILSDEMYTGTLLQGKQSTFNYKITDIINKPKTEWKRTENAQEAIVSKLDFELTQRIMRIDTRTSPDREKIYVFSGILICGCCGARMTRKSVPRKDGGKYNYYYCPTTKKKGCKKAPTIKESLLVECVLESIRAYIVNIASIESALAGSDGQKATAALVRRFEEQIADNQLKLEGIAGFKASLYENMVNGLLSKDEYRNLKADYADDELLLREAISTLNRELAEAREGKGERLKWIEHFKHFENLTELDHRVVINLIQSIRVITKSKISITFNFCSEFENALALLGQSETAREVA